MERRCPAGGLAVLKILFAWSGLTGYMGDCWRELARREGVELKVLVDLSEQHFGGNFSADDVMSGLDWRGSLQAEWTPDVVFTVGWRNPLCRETATKKWGSGTKLVCCFDMPWEWRFRKIAARFILQRYLRRFDAAFVPGEVAERYARWLGFRRIFKGLFATDIHRFGEWIGGGGFLYVGRDCCDKGTDVLRRAHEIYRSRGGKWPLKIVNGVSPNELGHVYSQADAFVLASRWEPWGVVLVEAAAAGLPIICTDKCGARCEVVRDNGVDVKSNNAEALAAVMHEIENMPVAERRAMGAKGQVLAQPYSCQTWADRVMDICNQLVK